MSSTVYFILLVTCLSTVAASDCYNDLKFTISAWKASSSWVATGSVDSKDTTNSNYDTANQNPFALDVSVDECNNYCPAGPYVKITATAKKTPTKALPGYDYHAGVGYYKYHSIPKDWDTARKICNDEGAHLGVINSEEEAQIYANYLKTVDVPGTNVINLAYIGFHDRFVEGEYLTIFDQPLSETGFYRWFSAGEPNNAGGKEFCGSFHTNGGLNDVSCTYRLAFICEQELC